MTHKLLITLGIVVVLAVIGTLAYVVARPGQQRNTTDSSAERQSSERSRVTWSSNGQSWQPDGTPPSCDEPLLAQSPTDLTKATHILSPGQTRTGGYKPHGGFRFDGMKNNEISVVAPLDAYVTRGSRYYEAGEVQYMFDFVASCGIMYRVDHLLTLSPAFQALAEKMPEPMPDDSRTMSFDPPVAVTQGDVIATAVGFEKLNGTGNTSFDFGVYDLRQKNKAAQNASWVSQHQQELELAAHAICWFDKFPAADNARIQQVLAKDTQSSRESDYCAQ